MRLFRITSKALAVAVLAVTALSWSAVRAGATGTMTIHHYSGQTNVYDGVEIKVLHGALFLTSADGKGTLVVHRAACSYQGKLLVCFATNATLVQSGETTPLDLKTGTLYFNSTDEPQPLVLSSQKVPPHTLLGSLTTSRGTYVTMNGRIDKVVK